MMGRINKDYKDNLDTSDGNSDSASVAHRLREASAEQGRNPFIFLCAI